MGTRLQLRLPFYHLKSQGFWLAHTAEMHPAHSPENCVAIELNPEFYSLIADRDFRIKARLILVARYFTEIETSALFSFLGIPGQKTGSTNKAADRELSRALAAGKRRGRSARFQVRVVDDYFHTCALTGYRCFTDDGTSIVDAAHTVGWAGSQNDDHTNGLALSKNAHWMFDRGLWSIDDEMRILVAPAHRFTEAGPHSLGLRGLVGRHLQFDPSAKLRPAAEFLRAHRHEHGFIP